MPINRTHSEAQSKSWGKPPSYLRTPPIPPCPLPSAATNSPFLAPILLIPFVYIVRLGHLSRSNPPLRLTVTSSSRQEALSLLIRSSSNILGPVHFMCRPSRPRRSVVHHRPSLRAISLKSSSVPHDSFTFARYHLVVPDPSSEEQSRRDTDALSWRSPSWRR
jgi:hypothetical protein